MARRARRGAAVVKGEYSRKRCIASRQGVVLSTARLCHRNSCRGHRRAGAARPRLRWRPGFGTDFFPGSGDPGW